MRELAGRLLRKQSEVRTPLLSFGSWSELEFPVDGRRVVQVCHPDWRGVRTVAYSFRTPVIECDDLERWAGDLIGGLQKSGVEVVVIQGWPPGSAAFVEQATGGGMDVRCVLHSSPVQHGGDPLEAKVVDEILGLASSGALSRFGMAKAGVQDAFGALGFEVDYVPNRIPDLPEVTPRDLGSGIHIGVFAEPYWRKNVTTQILAAGLIDDATIHVLRRPENAYLESVPLVEHGELPYDEFVSLQASVDLNLYVTLSECHPSTPQESYMTGVPCLMSRVSSVFRSDSVLWDLTTTDEPDNPTSIASAAGRLMESSDEAIGRARAWMERADRVALERWEDFVDAG